MSRCTLTLGAITRAARESAARLGKDSVELGQLHWSTGNYQPLQERALWAGIADAYDAGKGGAVGGGDVACGGEPTSVSYSVFSYSPVLNTLTSTQLS